MTCEWRNAMPEQLCLIIKTTNLTRPPHSPFQEFNLQISSRKPVVLSINLLSKDLMVQRGKETRYLEDQLRTLNQRWDRVCAKASVWFSELQIELMQCGGFHDVIDELLSWLNATEQEVSRQEPVDFTRSHQALRLKYNKFKVRAQWNH